MDSLAPDDTDPLVAGQRWTDWGRHLSYAFQPIVQMRTGRCHGYEALVRGFGSLGYRGPMDLFDAAAADGGLADLEALLIGRAVETFCKLSQGLEAKLFLNVDARLPQAAELVAAHARASGRQIVHEISERDSSAVGERLESAVGLYRRSGIGIALDDFGVGFGGLKLLYEAKPDYVKIDRFFIDGIERDMRKRAIVGYLVSYAHALGVATIAEGIETPPEFYTCRDLGCDFAQGYLLARPASFAEGLPQTNEVAIGLDKGDRRRSSASRERLSELLERIPPLRADAPRSALLELFGKPTSPPVVPVVDKSGVPKGLVREHDLKPFVYSRYGVELLRNRASGNRLDEFLVPCAICDINTPIEQVVEAFSADAAADGVIIVEGGEYAGLLGSHSLLRLVHEHRLAAATDQNPLTRLPGNAAIVRKIEAVLADADRGHLLAYLDFDNFKPFNDAYGFRHGDRAILMFSERLKVLASAHGGFAGHIGGDDFVLLLSGEEEPLAATKLGELLTRFRLDAESLYDAESRDRGWFEGKQRDGGHQRFPLLAASAVALFLAAGRATGDSSLEAVVQTVAAHKLMAKASASKIVTVRM